MQPGGKKIPEESSRYLDKSKTRPAKRPEKKADEINPLLPASKVGDAGRSILKVRACLSRKNFKKTPNRAPFACRRLLPGIP
jgi:hypothetical protein